MPYIARGLFGSALLIALALAMAASQKQDFPSHRALALRAYAVGMGLGDHRFGVLPALHRHGQPPIGLTSNILFVISWVLNIAVAEVLTRHSSRSRPGVPN